MVKKHFLHILLSILALTTAVLHAESSLFEDPVPKYDGHGPTKIVPLWPLYYYKKYTSKGASRKHILWPIYTKTITPEQNVTQILSFQNEYPRTFSKHTYVLWPLAGFQSDPEFGYNDWIFPILWQSNVKGYTRQNVVFPLYWYSKPDDGNMRHLNIALLNHNFWGPGYHNHLLLPIAWTKWGKKRGFNGYSHLLFPLFYFNRDIELAEGKFGNTNHVLKERAFITLFYRWYHDKIAPEGLAQVENYGIFPLSFYKTENYTYRSNGNILRNKIFFLFPSFASVRLNVVRPNKPPVNLEQLAEEKGFKIMQRDIDLYFPLYFHAYGYQVIDSPIDLKDTPQIPTEYDFKWIFPYYSSYARNPVQSLSAQEIPVPDEKPKDIFMPSRIQGNVDDYVKRTSGVPLLYHNSRKTWKEGLSPKVIVDQRFFYLFPYVSRYAKNKNGEGRKSTFMLLAGWGYTDLKTPDLPGYSRRLAYLFPFFLKSHRHSIGAAPYSMDDRENSFLWLPLYYHSRKRIGKSIGRTDVIFPLAYKSDEEHAKNNWWFALLAGNFERQIPLQSKFDKDKYPVTIYEDEAPVDYTRKISFLLPFWFAKYNLNSAYWMLFPFYGRSQSTPDDDTAVRTTTIPLALAHFKTSENADGTVKTRDFAAAGLYYKSSESQHVNDQETQSYYWHALPLLAMTSQPNHRRITAAIPPVSIDKDIAISEDGRVLESYKLASPHRWLPVFRRKTTRYVLSDDKKQSPFLSSQWLFPFYSLFDNTTERASRTTLGGGLLYYDNHTDGIQNKFILSGLLSTKRYDPLFYGSNSTFFGIIGNDIRSWGTKFKVFPFYTKQESENMTSEWSLFGGMFGSKDTPTYHVSKIFFFPKVSPNMSEDVFSVSERHNKIKELKRQHLDLAQEYAKRNYPEHAAVEFLLADGEYEDDIRLLHIAADQFAKLDPDKLESLLKKVPPNLLTRTPEFSPDTFVTYFSEVVFSKSTELYHKLLMLTETHKSTTVQPNDSDSVSPASQETAPTFNSVALSLALLCFKYEKFEQCFDILKQRYEKSQGKMEAMDLLHCYLYYSLNYQPFNRTKPHHQLIDNLLNTFPGDPLIEFFHAQKEHCPQKDAYLDDTGIKKFNGVLELSGENILKAPTDRGQALSLPPWPEPFNHVSPNDFPSFQDIMRAAHDAIALCYQRKLRKLRTDVFGPIRLSSIYTPETPFLHEQKRKEKEMTPQERQIQTTNFINHIMLHLSQGKSFEPFIKTFESTKLYPCKRIQSQVLMALKKDYQADLDVNHFMARKEQLVKLDKILWQISYDISYLRNWNATLVQGGPSDKGNGPIPVEADPNGFVDIDYAFNGIDHCTVEATTTFHNYFPRKLTLHLGFDHTLSVELNGTHVFGPTSQHIARRDQKSIVMDIPEGDVTLKFIIKDDLLNFGFFARFTDENGMPFFFNDLHQLYCKACGDQIENWSQAITPQLKLTHNKAQ